MIYISACSDNNGRIRTFVFGDTVGECRIKAKLHKLKLYGEPITKKRWINNTKGD